MYLFYLDRDSNSLKAYTWDPANTWSSHGALNHVPSNPRLSNSLAVASWHDNNQEQNRLYYVTEKSDIVELNINCAPSASCSFTHQSLPQVDISETSNIAVVQWGNSTTVYGTQIRVYYLDNTNTICEVAQNGTGSGWLPHKSLGINTYPGSSIGAMIEAFDPVLPQYSVYFINPDGNLSFIEHQTSWKASKFHILYWLR